MGNKINKNILVTGNAGFIGFHLVKKILEKKKYNVVGIDSINNYYDTVLKKERLKNLKILDLKKKYIFYKIKLEDKKKLNQLFKKYKFSVVINLAAQAGVRYSLKNPGSYMKSNVEGFFNLIELSKTYKIKHLIYASTSSVYGANKKIPFNEDDQTNHPLQLYAATKKFNELIAHSYSNLFKIPTTGLRFFTVYGPWGRPDMALFKFTKNILNKKPIEVFNFGNHSRDFTYIEDIVEAIYRLISKPPSPKNKIPYNIFNIGNNKPVSLQKYIAEIEKQTQKKSIQKLLPLQPGDVQQTFANSSKLYKYTGFKPKTEIAVGIKKFIEWYKDYYKIKQ